jgi:hypothetical protein
MFRIRFTQVPPARINRQQTHFSHQALHPFPRNKKTFFSKGRRYFS